LFPLDPFNLMETSLISLVGLDFEHPALRLFDLVLLRSQVVFFWRRSFPALRACLLFLNPVLLDLTFLVHPLHFFRISFPVFHPCLSEQGRFFEAPIANPVVSSTPPPVSRAEIKRVHHWVHSFILHSTVFFFLPVS